MSLLCAAVFTAAATLGVFYSPDQMLSDSLYQTPKALDGNIFVIGIDDRAMEDISPYQTWGRDVMAMAIEALNADPDCRPAAIGIDVHYTRESEADLDAYLAEAAGEYGNVVTASVANFGTELATEDTGNFYLEDYAVLSYEEPYEALRSVTSQGHINAMYDADGVLRHAILEIDLPGGFYEGISVSDLLSGDFPAELFDGAIVLIGPYAAGLSDHVTTAADRASLMYGVEFQANVIQQILNQDFKTEVPDPLQAAALFVISAACLWFFLNRKLRYAVPVWLLAAGGASWPVRGCTGRAMCSTPCGSPSPSLCSSQGRWPSTTSRRQWSGGKFPTPSSGM